MATVTTGYSWISGETVTPAKLISTGTPTISNIANADVGASAAIAGSKINPDFAAQDIKTTGNLLSGNSASVATVHSGNSALSPAVQVVGTTRAGSSVGCYNYDSGAAVAAELVFSKSLNTTKGSHTAVTTGDTLGSVTFNGSNGSAFLNAAAIKAQVDAAVSVLGSDMPGRLTFSTTANGSDVLSERMRIDNSGNVGIANTSPSEKLDVTGNIKASGQMLAANGTNSAPSISFGSDTDTGIFRSGTNAVGVATSGTERLTVSSGGDVGVGTTTPAYKLDVNGSVNVASGASLRVGGTKVVEGRITGWAAPTGSATRTAFATGSVNVEQLAERVKALIDDLRTHGLIGS